VSVADVLADAFGRVRDVVHAAVEGLSPEELAYRVDPDANSIAWLVWHLARVQDDHIAEVADTGQVWTDGGWVDRFGLPFDPSDIGYGHTTDEVGDVRAVTAELLTDYYDAVYERTMKYVVGLTDADLPRVVDEGWVPPVTLGVRLVSVISDGLQHAGQAAFVRGVLSRG
jgi:uncharacterized damage-inducible protein DinB